MKKKTSVKERAKESQSVNTGGQLWEYLQTAKSRNIQVSEPSEEQTSDSDTNDRISEILLDEDDDECPLCPDHPELWDIDGMKYCGHCLKIFRIR